MRGLSADREQTSHPLVKWAESKKGFLQSVRKGSRKTVSRLDRLAAAHMPASADPLKQKLLCQFPPQEVDGLEMQITITIMMSKL